jgi:hypothetical protein
VEKNQEKSNENKSKGEIKNQNHHSQFSEGQPIIITLRLGSWLQPLKGTLSIIKRE